MYVHKTNPHISGLNGRLNARLRDFARLVYQCFKPYVAKYTDIEKSVLAAEIKFVGVQTSKVNVSGNGLIYQL